MEFYILYNQFNYSEMIFCCNHDNVLTWLSLVEHGRVSILLRSLYRYILEMNFIKHYTYITIYYSVYSVKNLHCTLVTRLLWAVQFLISHFLSCLLRPVTFKKHFPPRFLLAFWIHASSIFIKHNKQHTLG
jgi:hypothetical protein